MCVALSIVPVVSQGLCFAPVTTYYYLGGFIRSPHPAILMRLPEGSRNYEQDFIKWPQSCQVQTLFS